MRFVLLVVAVFGLSGVAASHDLGNQAPVKTPLSYPESVPNPERQGGDTIFSAVIIPDLPYTDTGTTVGYGNDYDEVCPWGGNAPDVVYKYEPMTAQTVDIDLCGSDFDTKLYVYDSALGLVACNDDHYFADDPCGVYVSKLENVALLAGGTYYIVIDGYGSASGTYILNLTEYEPCVLACPDGAFPEGEPPLVDDYVDEHNSGCGESFLYWQELTADAMGDLTLCGVSGWYNFQGATYRDTDWYILISGPGESIEITGDAESETFMFELGPQDCYTVDVLQQVTAGPCAPASMTITGYPEGAPVWFWVGPTTFVPPSGASTMYDYVVWFSGLAPEVLATEATTWGSLKALYE